ncbi:MAG TPA: hypothetical protein VNT52_03740 [Acidimicrobiales bacterium]|nr:hypothetical protein [Acidimicrobiales bacterium]
MLAKVDTGQVRPRSKRGPRCRDRQERQLLCAVADGQLEWLFHKDGIAVHGYDHVPPYPASHG